MWIQPLMLRSFFVWSTNESNLLMSIVLYTLITLSVYMSDNATIFSVYQTCCCRDGRRLPRQNKCRCQINRQLILERLLAVITHFPRLSKWIYRKRNRVTIYRLFSSAYFSRQDKWENPVSRPYRSSRVPTASPPRPLPLRGKSSTLHRGGADLGATWGGGLNQLKWYFCAGILLRPLGDEVR